MIRQFLLMACLVATPLVSDASEDSVQGYKKFNTHYNYESNRSKALKQLKDELWNACLGKSFDYAVYGKVIEYQQVDHDINQLALTARCKKGHPWFWWL